VLFQNWHFCYTNFHQKSNNFLCKTFVFANIFFKKIKYISPAFLKPVIIDGKIHFLLFMLLSGSQASWELGCF